MFFCDFHTPLFATLKQHIKSKHMEDVSGSAPTPKKTNQRSLLEDTLLGSPTSDRPAVMKYTTQVQSPALSITSHVKDLIVLKISGNPDIFGQIKNANIIINLGTKINVNSIAVI